MIAVTGATGKLGQLVIEDLLKHVSPSEIVALVRNTSKAENLQRMGLQVRQADYDQFDSWTTALKGVEKLLLISSNEVGKREAQHQTVVRAAKDAKVKHLAYTSILRANESTLALAKEHLATETLIKESGIPFTFLRNGWYLENHTENLGSALQSGVIHGAAVDGRFSSASRNDYAQAASQVLRSSGSANKIYELAGDISFSLNELATEVSKQAKKPIAYANHTFEDFKNALIGFGLPEGFAHILADSDLGASKGQLQSDSKDLSKLIGHPTTSLSEAVRVVLK